MCGRLAFPLSGRVLVALFFHFCAFQCWHTFVIFPMVTLSLLAQLVIVSYWKPAFSKVKFVVSVVSISIFAASVIVVS